MSDITLMLQAVDLGEKQASEDLLPLVYDELRRLAAVRMTQEMPGQTLQATALVHEAWLRLVENDSRTWENRAHFYGAAAEAMRRILIERARRKARLRHGGGQRRMEIDELQLAQSTPDDRILLINEGLARLEVEHPERAKIVLLRYFGGLTNKQVAETLGMGERTVDRHWVCAKAWLFRYVSAQS